MCLLLNIRREADMALLAGQMVRRIAETGAFGETVLSVRASIGVALYPRDGEAADVLLKKAYEAMYKAKGTEAGVVLYRESRSL